MMHPEIVAAVNFERARLKNKHPHLDEQIIDDMAYSYVQACCMADTALIKEMYALRLVA